MSPRFDRLMPNFSHGTAGIVDFLASLYLETKRKLDGAPVAITRWSSAFQAVAVSAGRHTVDFAFRSPYPLLMWLHFFSVIAGYVWFARALVEGAGEWPKRRVACGA